MISVSYHGTVNVLQGTMEDALSPFGRAEWFAHLAGAGAEPFVAIAAAGDKTAALPLARANGRLESLVNWYSFSWRPLLSNDAELLTQIAAGLRGKSHRVTMWPVPDEDGSASSIELAFRNAGWKVSRERSDHNHVLPVNGRSFAEYWAGRPGRMRTTLKRKAKKVEWEILTGFDEAAWSEYEAVYDHSWKPEEGDPALLRAFAREEGAAGRLRLAIARKDGEAVAAQFWTVEGGTAYIHKLAHLEEHKNLSAGTTLSAALFEHVIDKDGVDLVDFGTGDDPYKRDWMEEDRPRYRIDCLDPARPASWPALIKRAIRRVAPASRQS